MMYCSRDGTDNEKVSGDLLFLSIRLLGLALSSCLGEFVSSRHHILLTLSGSRFYVGFGPHQQPGPDDDSNIHSLEPLPAMMKNHFLSCTYCS